MSSLDYATAFGIHSVAAAAIFAALFSVLGIWYIRQSVKNTTAVYIMLTVFCAIRVTAFIIRALMANSTSDGSNLDLFIVDQVLFAVGFFPLLYSAYNLTLDRDVLAGGKRGNIFSFNLLRNPRAFRLALTAAVAVGAVASVDITSSKSSNVSTGRTLRKVSTIVFLALTGLQAGQTVWFFRDRDSGSCVYRPTAHPWGHRHGRYLLCLISVFMLVREIFLTATMNNAAKQNDERLWYPLVALPEFLAVVCYAVSGLVPTRAALKEVDLELVSLRQTR
ncbi:hypothetical protein DFH06DRAFT_976491 [Mycena polygramma]|nr:hypothetical protein DFH06DRAFT_976491 [Mycena polygramma]